MKDKASCTTIYRIVFAIESEFSKHAAVAIQSLICNSSNTNKYYIYILHKDCNVEVLEKIKQMKTLHVVIVDINLGKLYLSDLVSSNNFLSFSRFGIETFFRCLIPVLFRKKDIVLYLDSDVIVKCDIADIFAEISFSPASWIAAHGASSRTLSDGLKYNSINAGVILFNCNVANTNDFTNNCICLFKAYSEKLIPINDQEIISIISAQHILQLPPEYNFIWGPHRFDKNRFQVSEVAVKYYFSTFQDAKIIHYINADRPTTDSDGIFSLDYYKYAKLTPFCDNIFKFEAQCKASAFARLTAVSGQFVALAMSFHLCYAKNDLDSALIIAKQLITFEVDCLFYWRCLIEIYIDLDRAEQALQISLNCLEVYPNSYLIYGYLIKLYRLQNNLQGLIMCAEKISLSGTFWVQKLLPLIVPALLDIGETSLASQLIDANINSISDYEICKLRIRLLALSEKEECIPILLQMIEKYPFEMSFRRKYFQLLYEDRGYKQILKEGFLLLAQSVNLAFVYYEIGRAFYSLGDKSTSLHMYQVAIEKQMDCRWAYVGVSFIHIENNNFAQADAIIKIMIELFPSWSIAYRQLSYLHSAKSEFQEAFIAAKKAHEFEPTNKSIKGQLEKCTKEAKKQVSLMG